jgi:hypothetical protein
MRRAAFPLSIVVLGVAVFAAWMHPAVLWPTNMGWLLVGDDRGQSAIGLAAYLRAGGPWPGLHEPLLAAPEGIALLFTDSIPLLGLLLKPFAPLLPVGAQYLGLWYLACLVLHAGLAAALIRRHAPDALAAWCGAALLTLMPALFNRFGHASLCAQWLLLWALWVFVEPRRARSPWWWAAVTAVAALIHAYLLLMVLAFWSAAALERLVREPGRVRTLALAIAALLPALAIMAVHGAFGGPYMNTGTFGNFPAALDGWWNPLNPDYTALLPSSPRAPDGRGYEGLQYLGAGLLLLVVLMAVRLVTVGLDDRRRSELVRLLWLLPPFAVFALVAIGPFPLWRGEPLFVPDLPRWLIAALDPVRAHGRLLWPVTYTLAFAAIVTATAWRRATLVIAAALALQIVDLTPMVSAIRATSARADDPRLFTRTTDPRWTALVARASAVQFHPPKPFADLQLMEELAWRAVRACRPVRYFYASREAVATRARIDADARALAAGRIDPTRLYVLLEGPTPPAIASRVRTLDGVRIVPPTRPAGAPPCASSPRSAP